MARAAARHRTANPLFETQLAAGSVASSKKSYVPFEIEVWSQGKEVFRHRLDLSGREVLVIYRLARLATR